MSQLTIKQAIYQGYTHCGNASKEWQSLQKISDIKEIDFKYQDFVLASKKPVTFIFNEMQIKELLVDVISDLEADETGRDDDNLYEALKSLDCSDLSKQVVAILNNNKTWQITDIKLILK